MTPFDHLLAIVLTVIGPLRSGGTAVRRFRSATPEQLPHLRRRAYRTAIAMQWLLTAAAAALWWHARRPLADLGLEPRFGNGLAGVALGLAIVIAFMIRERRRAVSDAEGLAEIRARLEPLRFLLPHDAREFGLFFWVALTAGACEEVLYRGYLIWYLSHALPWWLAAVLAATAFGLGHAYQGARGVVVGTLLGAFLAAVYLLTGSLFASMLIHALMDLHTGDLAWRAYDAEREERAREWRDASRQPSASDAGPDAPPTSLVGPDNVS